MASLLKENWRMSLLISAELQTAKQILTTSEHSIQFTYCEFPCHLKVNRDKHTLSNRRCLPEVRLYLSQNN